MLSTLDLPAEDRTRTYDLNHSFVFDATIRMLAEQGFSIKNVDKSKGVIITDFRYREAISLARTSDSPTRVRVYALIQIAPDGTQVFLSLDLQELSGESPQVYEPINLISSEARRYYRDFLNHWSTT